MPRRPVTVVSDPAPKKRSSVLRVLKTFAQMVFAAGALIGAVVLYIEVDRFLVSDPRLVLPGPPEPGVASDFFRVDGTHYSTEEQVSAVFAKDFGRSIYLCPIKERRRTLLGIPWIKDATILRVWPNRISVKVAERQPVAFLQVPGRGGQMTYSLIDDDGVILDPQRPVKLALLVVSGITPQETQTVRMNKVRRFLRLQSELGERVNKVSEVDVADIDNLKVKQVMDGRELTLFNG